jgi:hypothetical protein
MGAGKYLFWIPYSVPTQFQESIFLPLKVVGNEKEGGPGMCQSALIWLGPGRTRFISLLILLSSLILHISVSAPVMQNE